MPEDFFCSGRQVHIWLFEISASPSALDYFHRQLSSDEAARAARFRFPHLQVSFVIAHGVLRCLLAKYLDASPAAIQFLHNEQGKPRIAEADCRLQFNLSHSGSLAACALATDCDIGVDIEQTRPMPDLFHIARRFFSPDECFALSSIPATQQTPAFFDCWTRKEAYIKAIGGGLSIPLDSFCVSLAPGEPARLISNRENDQARWNLEAFDPGVAGYHGAVAYSGRARHLVIRRIEADEASQAWELREKLRSASL